MDATNLLVELHLRPLRHPHTPATTTGGAKSDEHYPAKWGQIRGAHPNEEPFGWIKTVGGGRKLRYKGRDRNRAWFKMTTAVYNVIRIAALDKAMA